MNPSHEGAAARLRGAPASYNPYPKWTDAHRRWRESWNRADELGEAGRVR